MSSGVILKFEGGIGVPNKKSAAKRVKQSEKRRLRNKSRKTMFKNVVKKILRAMEENREKDEILELYRKAQALIDKAEQKGVIHRNTAARKKSRLAARVNSYLKSSVS